MERVCHSINKNSRQYPNIVDEQFHIESSKHSETVNSLDEFVRMAVYYGHETTTRIKPILCSFINNHYDQCITALVNSEMKCFYFVNIISHCLKLSFEAKTKSVYYLERYGKFLSRSVAKKIHKMWIQFPLNCPYLHSMFTAYKLGEFRTLLTPLLCYSYYETPCVDGEFLELLSKLKRDDSINTKELFSLNYYQLNESRKFAVIVNERVEIVSFVDTNELPSFNLDSCRFLD